MICEPYLYLRSRLPPFIHTYIQNNNAFYPTRSTMSQTVLPFHLMINRWTSSRPDDLSHSTTHMSFCIERLPFPTRSFLLVYCIAKRNKQGVSRVIWVGWVLTRPDSAQSSTRPRPILESGQKKVLHSPLGTLEQKL